MRHFTPHSALRCCTAIMLTSFAAGVALADEPPSREAIQSWVVQLDADDFATREGASRQLVAAGSSAVKPVAAAIPPGGPEVRQRSFAILNQLALSSDGETADQADTALTQLAMSTDDAIAQRALHIRSAHVAQRHQRAIETIRRLGGTATVSRGKVRQVRINNGWTGGDEDLRCLRDLPEITWISLEDAPITDVGLQHLATLSHLQKLYLGRCQVKGPGLVHLKGLKKLSHLSLRYLAIDDRWLGVVGEMTHLQSLGLDDTQVTDDSLLLLANMTNLTSLWLDRSQVTGTGLAHLRPLEKLEMVDLDGLKIAAADLAQLQPLPKLTTLSLENSPTADEALTHLEKIETLRHLHLRNTMVTEQGVAKLLKALPSLKVER